MPDYLTRRHIMLEGSVAADVADAERAISALNAHSTTLTDTEALARLLLRAESVASSRIEGLEIGARRLLRAEATGRSLGVHVDVTANEVVSNIEAMVSAIQTVTSTKTITLNVILSAHEQLMANTRLAGYGGRIRTVQNWIGGSDYNPCSSSYVPPPPDLLPELLNDLIIFANADSLPALVQAALVHSQFETLHPFIDGNGRIGRVLIHLVLRRRGLAPRVLPPISLILATRSRDYVNGLTGTRYRGAATSTDARRGVNEWIALFADAARRSAVDAARFEERIREIQDEWRSRLGRVRANSAVDALIRILPGAPVLTVETASQMVGRTFAATNLAIERMVDAAILSRITTGRRNRAFEAPDIILAFTDFERHMASPQGDSRVSPHRRRVPARPRAS